MHHEAFLSHPFAHMAAEDDYTLPCLLHLQPLKAAPMVRLLYKNILQLVRSRARKPQAKAPHWT